MAELLSANRSLAKAYILKEGIKDLWRYTQINAANEFWKSWYRQAKAQNEDTEVQSAAAARLEELEPAEPE